MSLQIRSARHAVRVLQYADIHQEAWLQDSIVATVPPGVGLAQPSLACVLVDFAFTVQSDVSHDVDSTTESLHDDWGWMADSICIGGRRKNADGVSADTIKKYYALREAWDFNWHPDWN